MAGAPPDRLHPIEESGPLVAARADRAMAVPPCELVADGVWSIPMPLEHSPLRYSLTYALQQSDGVILVDAGYPSDSCWRALAAGLEHLGRTVRDVRGVVLTHNHPDHVGLAHRIRDTSGAWVALHRLDDPADRRRRHDGFLAGVATGLALAGVPSEIQREIVEASEPYAQPTETLRPDRTLDDGEMLQRGLQVLATPGHTRGHVSLLDRERRLLYGGDLILPQGRLQSEVVTATEDDPHGDYERSLHRVGELAIEEVLPGHNQRFTDVDAQIDVILEREQHRRAEIARAVCSHPGETAWELSASLTHPRAWTQLRAMARRLAVTETLAVLHDLAARGITLIEPGAPERHWPVTT